VILQPTLSLFQIYCHYVAGTSYPAMSLCMFNDLMLYSPQCPNRRPRLSGFSFFPMTPLGLFSVWIFYGGPPTIFLVVHDFRPPSHSTMGPFFISFRFISLCPLLPFDGTPAFLPLIEYLSPVCLPGSERGDFAGLPRQPPHPILPIDTT